MKFDHVAVNVADVARAVSWYRENLNARILYQDDSWAFLEVAGVRLALTLAKQHPGHIAFDVGPAPSEDFLAKAKTHRDGSISRYIVDPDGNAIEYIFYPVKTEKGGTPRG